MPVARTYNAETGLMRISLYHGYRDRLSHWSDIREYLPLLYDQARSRPECQIIELGTRRGNSTLAFLAGADESDGHVWSADVTDVRLDYEGMMPWRKVERWTFTCGDDLTQEVQDQLPAKADILFIDTSHEYEHTLSELKIYAPRVSPGGIILCHDTNLIGWPGYKAPKGIPPVRQALDEYCSESGLEWKNLAGEYGLGVIEV